MGKRLTARPKSIVEAYIHPGGRIGVLLEINCETILLPEQMI